MRVRGPLGNRVVIVWKMSTLIICLVLAINDCFPNFHLANDITNKTPPETGHCFKSTVGYILAGDGSYKLIGLPVAPPVV